MMSLFCSPPGLERLCGDRTGPNAFFAFTQELCLRHFDGRLVFRPAGETVISGVCVYLKDKIRYEFMLNF